MENEAGSRRYVRCSRQYEGPREIKPTGTVETELEKDPVHRVLILIRPMGDTMDRRQTGLFHVLGRV